MAYTPELNRLEALGIDTCIASLHYRNTINAELYSLMHPVELASWYINPVYEYLDHVMANGEYSQPEEAHLTKFFRRLKERRQDYIGLYLNNKLGKSCHPYWQAAVDMDRLKGRI